MASAPETTTAIRSGAGASDGSMKTFHRETTLRTAGGLSVTDITDQVQEAVRESGVRDGVCCVYSPHTTCSVRVGPDAPYASVGGGAATPTPNVQTHETTCPSEETACHRTV